MQWNTHVLRILELTGFVWARENNPWCITTCNQKLPNKMAKQYWRADCSMEEFLYKRIKKEWQKYYFQNEGKEADKIYPTFDMNDNCASSISIVYRKIYINKNFGKQKLWKQTTTLEVGEEGGNSRM